MRFQRRTQIDGTDVVLRVVASLALAAGFALAQPTNLSAFESICVEALVGHEGEADAIALDVVERMEEVAAANRVPIKRSNCYRNVPTFSEGTMVVEYLFNSMAVDRGDVIYNDHLMGYVGSGILVDLDRLDDPTYGGFEVEGIALYREPGYHGITSRSQWRVQALENAAALMERFADAWWSSR